MAVQQEAWQDLSEEVLLVRKWRRDALLGMGLTLTDARLLSESGADLHDMLAYLRHGCPVEMLRRIVL